MKYACIFLGYTKKITRIFCDRFRQCYVSFLVQPGRGPGIDMCLSAPGMYVKDNNYV